VGARDFLWDFKLAMEDLANGADQRQGNAFATLPEGTWAAHLALRHAADDTAFLRM
jgi:hypothetical protein